MWGPDELGQDWHVVNTLSITANHTFYRFEPVRLTETLRAWEVREWEESEGLRERCCWEREREWEMNWYRLERLGYLGYKLIQRCFFSHLLFLFLNLNWSLHRSAFGVHFFFPDHWSGHFRWSSLAAGLGRWGWIFVCPVLYCLYFYYAKFCNQFFALLLCGR